MSTFLSIAKSNAFPNISFCLMNHTAIMARTTISAFSRKFMPIICILLIPHTIIIPCCFLRIRQNTIDAADMDMTANKNNKTMAENDLSSVILFSSFFCCIAFASLTIFTPTPCSDAFLYIFNSTCEAYSSSSIM